MRKGIKDLGLILLLCLPIAATAQTRYSDPANRDRAKQIATSLERTVRSKEPQWKLSDTLQSEFGFQQYFRSRTQEVDVSIFVYDSPEEASKLLALHSKASSLTAGEELKGIGDEAFYMSHRYFSWIGVRKGRMLVEVRGPGPELTVTRRFAHYGLEQTSGK